MAQISFPDVAFGVGQTLPTAGELPDVALPVGVLPDVALPVAFEVAAGVALLVALDVVALVGVGVGFFVTPDPEIWSATSVAGFT